MVQTNVENCRRQYYATSSTLRNNSSRWRSQITPWMELLHKFSQHFRTDFVWQMNEVLHWNEDLLKEYELAELGKAEEGMTQKELWTCSQCTYSRTEQQVAIDYTKSKHICKRQLLPTMPDNIRIKHRNTEARRKHEAEIHSPSGNQMRHERIQQRTALWKDRDKRLW